MKFTTIWTIPAMTLTERTCRTGDLVLAKVAHHLPRRLAYWSFIDSGVRHIASNEVVPEVPYTVLLKRLGDTAGDAVPTEGAQS